MRWQKLLGSVVILGMLLAGCAATTDPADIYKGESSEQIFKKGEKALRKGEYKEAIKRLEALEVQYPYSIHIELAELHIIYAYYMSEDYPSAQSAAERYIHAWPANPHVVYAYYMRALAYYHQNLGLFEKLFPVDLSRRDLAPMRQAWTDFATVAQEFPDSEYAPAARQYMIYLRNMMAQHELNVAIFYFDHRAYVTAANRATDVIRHYEGAPAVKSALQLLAKSYRALHATDSEKEVLRVIRYNYPSP
jgi:outer membrane protein assembly factor BamD